MNNDVSCVLLLRHYNLYAHIKRKSVLRNNREEEWLVGGDLFYLKLLVKLA